MIADFPWMGGYGAFIWSAYGLSAVSLIAALVLTLSAYKRAKAKLAMLEKP